MKTLIAFITALILIGGGILLYQVREGEVTPEPVVNNNGTSTTTNVTPTPTTTPNNTTISTADIKITSPKKGATVMSPLTLTGEARGNWFFEASAPVYLEDLNGKKLAQGHIEAVGDWMTTNFVPFKGTLTWTSTSTGTTTQARVVFMNDNPSGLPSLQKRVEVPVTLSN